MTAMQKPPYEDITLLTTIMPHQNGVRTYLGKLVDVLPPGPYAGLPKIHKIAKVDMRPQMHAVKMNAVTKDNYGVPLQVDLLVRVSDAGSYMMTAPENVAYGIDEILKSAVAHEISTRFSQDDLKNNREELSDLMTRAVEKGIVGWGVKVDLTRVPTIAIPHVPYELEQERMVMQKEGQNKMVELEWRRQAIDLETAIAIKRFREMAVTESDMELYNNLQVAAAEAFELQKMGEAQALVLAKKADALQGFLTGAISRLIAEGMPPADAKETAMYALGKVFGREQNASEAGTGSDPLEDAIMGKVKAKIDGEAMRAEAKAAGVNPKFMMLMNTVRALGGAGNLNINNWGALWEQVGKKR